MLYPGSLQICTKAFALQAEAVVCALKQQGQIKWLVKLKTAISLKKCIFSFSLSQPFTQSYIAQIAVGVSAKWALYLS